MEHLEYEYKYSDAQLGLFIGISFLLALLSWFWFKNTDVFNPPQRFTVLFHNAAGLTTNAAVYVDGVQVGSVEQIDLQAKHRVLVGVKVNTQKAIVRSGAKFNILNNGVVGARYIDICLPDSQSAGEMLTPTSVLIGNDPVRPELVIDRLARQMNQIDFVAFHHATLDGINRASAAADKVVMISNELKPVAERACVVEDRVATLACNLNHTTQKLNKIFDNPKFSSDLKDTAEKAEATVAQLQETVGQVNKMLGDKELRTDVLDALSRLNISTQHVDDAVRNIAALGKDEAVRSDAKEILSKANDTVDKVNKLVSEPSFGTDLKHTLATTRSAVEDVDQVAIQLKQILGKRHPLLHMVFGRPGKLEDKPRTAETDTPKDELVR